MNWRAVASLVFAIVATGFYWSWNQGWLPSGQHSDATAPAITPCADLAQGCSFSVDGHDYHLQSDLPVSPSHPFTLWLDGTPLTAATISWKMTGMDMGPNRFHFAPDAKGRWQTRTALPFCTQSRNDWLLTINVNKNKAILAVQPR